MPSRVKPCLAQGRLTTRLVEPSPGVWSPPLEVIHGCAPGWILKCGLSQATDPTYVTTMSHMCESVGVRELRRDLSGYLRRVERGESFAVTLRGREVATLGPAGSKRDALTRLVHERHAIPARGDVLDLEPLELAGGPPLSELLDDVRADRP